MIYTLLEWIEKVKFRRKEPELIIKIKEDDDFFNLWKDPKERICVIADHMEFPIKGVSLYPDSKIFVFLKQFKKEAKKEDFVGTFAKSITHEFAHNITRKEIGRKNLPKIEECIDLFSDTKRIRYICK